MSISKEVVKIREEVTLLKQSLFGYKENGIIIEGIIDKIYNGIGDCKILIENHMSNLTKRISKIEDEKLIEVERVEKNKNVFSRRRFETLKMVMEGVIAFGVAYISYKLTWGK